RQKRSRALAGVLLLVIRLRPAEKDGDENTGDDKGDNGDFKDATATDHVRLWPFRGQDQNAAKRWPGLIQRFVGCFLGTSWSSGIFASRRTWLKTGLDASLIATSWPVALPFR